LHCSSGFILQKAFLLQQMHTKSCYRWAYKVFNYAFRAILMIECCEIEQIGDVGREGGTDEIGKTLLKNLLPSRFEWRWVQIRENIKKGGVSGTGHGYSLIHALAQAGHVLGVQLLLEKGANINAKDNQGKTVFHYAILSRNNALVRMLLEARVERALNERLAVGEPPVSPTIKEVVELESPVKGIHTEHDHAPVSQVAEFNLEHSLEPDEEIAALLELLAQHPGSSHLRKELSDVYNGKSDRDEAIVGWWTLLEMYPYRLEFLRSLHSACMLKWVQSKKTSLLRFALICALSFLSRKFREWNMGESDWSPLASEDEIMMVTPNSRRLEWRCVDPLLQDMVNIKRRVLGLRATTGQQQATRLLTRRRLRVKFQYQAREPQKLRVRKLCII